MRYTQTLHTLHRWRYTRYTLRLQCVTRLCNVRWMTTKREHLTVRVNPAAIVRLDQIAAVTHQSRSATLRQILSLGMKMMWSQYRAEIEARYGS